LTEERTALDAGELRPGLRRGWSSPRRGPACRASFLAAMSHEWNAKQRSCFVTWSRVASAHFTVWPKPPCARLPF